ncbi:MAG TPA: porin [Verrucomicrobiae bacterium]|nr:porin [Verrucomicrobiae bacterium]
MKTIAAIAGFLSALISAGAADTSTNSTETVGIESLKRQIQELSQKVQALEQQRRSDQQIVTNAVQIAPKISLGSGGFKVVSADTNFVMNVRGYMQLDSRTFFSDTAPGADGFLLRRVRPTISGTVFHDFDYQFTAKFGSGSPSGSDSPSISDAYVNYHPWPELQLEAGRFKAPVGLERLQSAQNISFNERSLVSDLVPHNDQGMELHGDLFGGRANYAAGIFNSDVDGADAGNSGFDNRMGFAGRVFFQPLKNSEIAPLKGFGFGVGGSYGNETAAGAVSGGYKSDGQQKFFTYTSGTVGDGAHWRISPQAYYYWGPFGLLGEYVISDQKIKNTTASADLQNTAWEISAGWMLTGEKATYGKVTPRHPFHLKGGGWGAWQIVARYEELNVDDMAFPVFANPNTSASAAQGWSVGLNWWLNRNVRIMTSFSRTTFTGGDDGAVAGQSEDILFTRLQLAF